MHLMFSTSQHPEIPSPQNLSSFQYQVGLVSLTHVPSAEGAKRFTNRLHQGQSMHCSDCLYQFPIPLHRASLASANIRTNVNYENERTRDAFTHDTLLTSFSSFDMQQYSPSLPSPSLYLCSECRQINATLAKAQDYAERVSKAAGPSGPLELIIDGEEHSTSAASEPS